MSVIASAVLLDELCSPWLLLIGLVHLIFCFWAFYFIKQFFKWNRTLCKTPVKEKKRIDNTNLCLYPVPMVE